VGGRLVLGTYPTPVQHVPSLGLWVKRDDLVAPRYGGNKVRKLEHLLADAKAQGKKRIVTIGAAGSHQIVATALYGKEQGFEVDAVLVSQPASEHARANLRIALSLGVNPFVAPAWAVAPAIVASRLGRDAYVVPLGGSNALGSLGFFEAGIELSMQIKAGLLPEPEIVVLALGSGGTAAGLAVGFEREGLKTKIVGVVVSPPVRLVRTMAGRLAKKTAELVGLSRGARERSAERIEVDGRWLGRGYGYSTHESESAIGIAADVGLELDPTYTAKAFACALARVKETTGPVLYWHTLSTAPLDAWLANTPELPARLAHLLR
jgi:1-aminocyclopropane-1-carboxylate deaminase/D-cysteine desulfhydrase-like pyridoxal-dependent ACC family enzyme